MFVQFHFYRVIKLLIIISSWSIIQLDQIEFNYY